jgi:hypothetical protein
MMRGLVMGLVRLFRIPLGSDIARSAETDFRRGMTRMARIGIGVGILGAFMNSLVQTKHAIGALTRNLGGCQTLDDLINTLLFVLSNEMFLGLVAFLLLAIATWLPLAVLVMKRFHFRLRVTIGIGVLGSLLTTVMETRYAAAGFKHLFSDSPSIWDKISRLSDDDFIFAGAMYFVIAIIATWIPWILLICSWCIYKFRLIRVAQPMLGAYAVCVVGILGATIIVASFVLSNTWPKVFG